MSLLPPGQVRSLRRMTARALPDQAIIRRLTRVPDGGGGTTETWADVETVPCRIDPAGGGEDTAGARVNDATTHRVTLEAKADVRPEDQMVIDAVTYDVTVVLRRGQWEITRVAEVKEA